MTTTRLITMMSQPNYIEVIVVVVVVVIVVVVVVLIVKTQRNST